MSTEVSNFVNSTAFLTTTGSAVMTVAGAMAAVESPTAKKAAAFAGIALGGVALTGSAVTAWFDPSSKSVKSYFNNVARNFGYAASVVGAVTAHAVGSAIIEGLSAGIRQVIFEKVARNCKDDDSKKPARV